MGLARMCLLGRSDDLSEREVSVVHAFRILCEVAVRDLSYDYHIFVCRGI